MASYFNLISIFEYIADAGYIAYNEEFSYADTTPGVAGKGKNNSLIKYKWQEKKINPNYHLLRAKTIYKYLYPRLTAIE